MWQRYFVKTREGEKGPYPKDAVLESLLDGHLSPDTLVRATGEEEWFPALDLLDEPAADADANSDDGDVEPELGATVSDTGSFGGCFVALGIVLVGVAIWLLFRPGAGIGPSAIMMAGAVASFRVSRRRRKDDESLRP